MIAIFFVFFLSAGESLLLRYAPAEGRVSLYETEMESRHQLTERGAKMDFASRLYLNIRESVGRKEGEYFPVTVALEKTQFLLEGEELNNKTVEDVLRSTHTLFINEEGKLKESKEMDGFSFASLYPGLPAGPKRAGESWPYKDRMILRLRDMNIETEVKGTYTLVKWNNKEAVISGEYELYAFNIYREKKPVRVESRFLGKGKSEIIYNHRVSRIVSLDQSLELSTVSQAYYPDFPIQNVKMNHTVHTRLKWVK
ncbi:MAG TPA: hypothetical protein VJC03_05085 [bacterium]|nr:hypothetical protein [bacterium]